MISGLKNRDKLSEKQQRIRNKELIGLSLTKREKKLIEGVVPMKNISKYHDRITTPPSSIEEPDEIDLDEILREMGYEMEEGGVDDEVEVDDLDEDFDEVWGYYDDEEIDIKNLTRTELGELIYKVLTDKDYQ